MVIVDDATARNGNADRRRGVGRSQALGAFKGGDVARAQGGWTIEC